MSELSDPSWKAGDEDPMLSRPFEEPDWDDDDDEPVAAFVQALDACEDCGSIIGHRSDCPAQHPVESFNWDPDF